MPAMADKFAVNPPALSIDPLTSGGLLPISPLLALSYWEC